MQEQLSCSVGAYGLWLHTVTRSWVILCFASVQLDKLWAWL